MAYFANKQKGTTYLLYTIGLDVYLTRRKTCPAGMLRTQLSEIHVDRGGIIICPFLPSSQVGLEGYTFAELLSLKTDKFRNVSVQL